jgi:BsuBI/PstI restriction endonuclease domain/BsuBI/PstI restriction endonuclease HTH domain
LLAAIGVPIDTMTERRKRCVALALLAIANLKPNQPWDRAAIWSGESSHNLTTRQIISFWNEHYGEKVSSGSYDDVRRKDLIYLVEAGIALRSAANPDANTNNPTRGYAVSPEARDLLLKFGQPGWRRVADRFKEQLGSLAERMQRRRQQAKIPVSLPSGAGVMLASGPHNEIQRAIIEEFLPRFVPGAEVLYVGDATKKSLVLEETRLKQLGFFELAHDALPDVVAYDARKNWIILVEAVHSSNPISQLRHLMLERMTKDCTAPRVYVSAFQNRLSLREWLLEISWETEVWLVDTPDHLIHFNGDSFFGPHETAGMKKVGQTKQSTKKK